MSENNKSYRIRTTVGADNYVSVNLEQDYDTFDVLSIKISSSDLYRLHNSNYGVVVGRVQANGGFGVPNAKISIFIPSDEVDSEEIKSVYSYASSVSKDGKGVRYNLLPDEKVDNCHQVVGTFPNKRYLLDNEVIMEVFDKYYKYTTRTNNAGDYMICGVPTGNHALHMDLDLSDCGILSQRPRDFVFKGYTIEQFENPNMFKTGTSYSNLSQIFSQDQTVYVHPFWGNNDEGETIGITRADIEIAFKFEPTCVFMGCIAGDNASNGISKKCMPTPDMGNMDELVTGKGTIEMIRKTYGGSVEEFQVKGTELIDGNGVWCYQIPMNLDYMITDEYGNMVPTDNPDKGIPTRARVRFRMSLQDMEKNTSNYFRPKVLVPHNPQNLDGVDHEDYDYEFGTFTKDDSFRDLFWNNVYTVKSYIPRFQKRKVSGWKESKFSGIKHVQNFGANNPMPYNNIRIRLPFMFKVMCILIKIFIKVVSVINSLISMFGNFLADIGDSDFATVLKPILGVITAGVAYAFKSFREWQWQPLKDQYKRATDLKMNVIEEGLCPDLENWYFSPMFNNNLWVPEKKAPKGMKQYDLLKQTLDSINADDDPYSIDDQNQDPDDEAKCLTIRTDYLISCIEMNLAQEYKVINFDFYNDWINGLIYVPRFMRYVRKKRKFLGITIVRSKVKGCMDDTKIFSKSRRYTQLCSLGFEKQMVGGKTTYSKVSTNLKNKLQIIKSNNLHKKRGLTQQKIFGKNGGICHEKETMYGQHVYYLKPCEWTKKTSPLNRKINLFATDIVLLGSLNNCDLYGIPQAFKHLVGSSYIMPTNLALTNMEENGPLYAYGDSGTMCSKNNQTTEGTDLDDLTRPINVIGSSSSALTNELAFYSGASTNYDTEYDDPSDTIAMTEAAGISWNYTGPGQGEIDKKKLYYPGGHFLGLSCVNSQTNIKSCINLERICELGVAMSQRKEDVRAVRKGESGEAELDYIYSVPTGFISGDDIIDDEFRTMFATMNKTRLIANKVNPENGYKVYDFQYSNPVNFNGEFTKYAGLSTPYNKDIEAIDESDTLASFGIERGDSRDDYDSGETLYTRTRTIEYPSVDYYMFRFGLTYDDLKRVKQKHLRQFGKEEKGVMYLPQYENSFYFYFGLKDGSTALDEFNKQFFSECDTSVLSSREPSISVSVSDFNICEGYSEVVPYLRNIEEPFIIELDGEIHQYEDEYEIEPFLLTIGEHNIRVRDANGIETQLKFVVGGGVIDGTYITHDFNRTWENAARTSADKDMFTGGYLEASDIEVHVPEDSDVVIDDSMKLVAGPEGGEASTFTSEMSDVSSGSSVLYLNSANTPYDVYLKYKCSGSSTFVYLKVSSFTLKDTSTVGLTMGSSEKIDYKLLNTSGFTDNWWTAYTPTGAISTDAPSAVTIRKSIIYPYEGENVPFSNNVLAVNGYKAVFGTPQSYTGVFADNKAYSTEYEEGWPAGYTVDDDMSYHPTTPQNVRNYNAMAYNGNVVCGDFVAKVVGQSGLTKAVTGTSPLLRDGDGCLFRPVPDGEVIPAYYVASNNSIVCLCDSNTAQEYSDGVIYPTIVYPVIKKAFKTSANYFELHDKIISETVDSNGDKSYEAKSEVYGEKVEAKIKNGVTYKGYFCGDSYITGILEEPENSDNQISTTLKDLQENDRIIALSGMTEERIETPSFMVTEGFPYFIDGDTELAYNGGSNRLYEKANEYKSDAISCNIEMNPAFYEEIYFENMGEAMMLTANGRSDAEYYFFAASATSSDYPFMIDRNYRFARSDKKDWIAGSPKEIFVLGQYTNNAIYDAEGQEVVVKLRDAGLRVDAYVPWTEESSDDDDTDGTAGMVVHQLKKISKQDWIRTDNDSITTYLNAVKEKSGYRVDFKKPTIIKTNVVSGSVSSMTKSILDKLGTMTPVRFNEANLTYFDQFVIVGKKEYTDDEGNASGIVLRVYLHPTEIHEVEGNYSMAALVTEANSGASAVNAIRVSDEEQTKVLYVKAGPRVTWNITLGSGGIVAVQGGPTTGFNQSEEYIMCSSPITFKINQNRETEVKTDEIFVNWSVQGNGKTIQGKTRTTITQDAAPEQQGSGGTEPEEITAMMEIDERIEGHGTTEGTTEPGGGKVLLGTATFDSNINYIKLDQHAIPPINFIETENIDSLLVWFSIEAGNISRDITNHVAYNNILGGYVDVTNGDLILSSGGNRTREFKLYFNWFIADSQEAHFVAEIDDTMEYKYKLL